MLLRLSFMYGNKINFIIDEYKLLVQTALHVEERKQ